MNPLNLSGKKEVKAGEVQQQEPKKLLNKTELFKTMIEAKKNRLNYARWRKQYGAKFNIHGLEGLELWGRVK
jgi:hypothetical protein